MAVHRRIFKLFCNTLAIFFTVSLLLFPADASSQEIETLEATHVFGVGRLTTARYSPRDEVFATGTATGKLLIWDAETGEIIQSVQAHTTGIRLLEFSPGGSTVATASTGSTVRLWDTVSGALLRTFSFESSYENKVEDMEFSPDGSMLATGLTSYIPSTSMPNTFDHAYVVRLWDSSSGGILAEIPSPGNIVGFAPGSATLAIGGIPSGVSTPGGRILVAPVQIWSLEPLESVKTLQVSDFSFLSRLTYSPDGAFILVVDTDGKTVLVDTSSVRIIHTLQDSGDLIRYRRTIQPMAAFSADSEKIVVSGHEHLDVLFPTLDAAIYCTDTGERLRTFRIFEQSAIGNSFEVWEADILSVDFSPDGSKALTASEDQLIRIWDVETGEELKRFEGLTGGVKSVAFSSNSRAALIARAYDPIAIRDVHSGRITRKLDLRIPFSISSSAKIGQFSVDGAEVFILSSGNLTTIDSQTGRTLRSFRPYEHGFGEIGVSRFDHSMDGRYLATTHAGAHIILWDAANAAVLRTFEEPSADYSNAIRFSPGSDRFLATYSGTSFPPDYAALWDIASGERIAEYLPVVNERIHDVAVSPDSSKVLIAGYDEILDDNGTAYVPVPAVTLWDAHTGTRMRSFLHNAFTYHIAFSADGDHFFAGNSDGGLFMCSTETGEIEKNFTGHTDAISSLAVSLDGTLLLSGSRDGTARLFPLAPRQSAVQQWELY